MSADLERAHDAAAWWRVFQDRLGPDDRVELPMLSGSMAPALPVGSTLIIAGVSRSKCRTGNVVVFRDGDRLVAHRLLLGLPPGRPRTFLQAGDAVSRPRWLKTAAIAGLVIAVRDPDGAQRDLRTPQAHREAKRLARRRLTRVVIDPFMTLLRRGKAWLQST